MDRRSVREMTEISHTELWAGLSVSARAAGQSPSCDLSTAVRINEQRRRSAPFPLFSHPKYTLAQPCMAKNSGALVFPALYLSELGQRDIPHSARTLPKRPSTEALNPYRGFRLTYIYFTAAASRTTGNRIFHTPPEILSAQRKRSI